MIEEKEVSENRNVLSTPNKLSIDIEMPISSQKQEILEKKAELIKTIERTKRQVIIEELNKRELIQKALNQPLLLRSNKFS